MIVAAQEQGAASVEAAALQICLIGANGPDTVGGLASYMRGLADGLSRQNDVSVIVRFSRTSGPMGMYAGAEQPRVIDQGGYKTHVIAPRRAWRPALRRLISLVTRPPLQPLARWLYRRAYQPSLAAAMPASINVVHYVGNGWELLGFAALAEARKRGVAFTVLPAVHPGTWGDSSMDVSLYNQADAVVVLSESERTHLIRRGVEPSRLHCCGLAPAALPDGDGAAFRQRHGLGDRPLVLFIGRKDRGKGYHALREAMPNILAVVPNACLVAIGPDREPPYPPVPDGALLDLGRADEVEKADALAACDVFCLPSTQESFGIVYVEAWAYGKPVVGGLALAVRELITDGANGYCVAQDEKAITAILVHLLRDSSLCEMLGAAGNKLQQEHFTWPTVIKVHRSVFQDALSASRRRAEGVP